MHTHENTFQIRVVSHFLVDEIDVSSLFLKIKMVLSVTGSVTRVPTVEATPHPAVQTHRLRITMFGLHVASAKGAARSLQPGLIGQTWCFNTGRSNSHACATRGVPADQNKGRPKTHCTELSTARAGSQALQDTKGCCLLRVHTASLICNDTLEGNI